MQYLINSYKGAGKLLFGMSRSQIENLFSYQPRRFLKFKEDEYQTDVYEDCYIYFKAPDVCEAVEFFSPAEPIFENIDLLTEPYSKTKELFLQLDRDSICNEDGIISKKLGVGIYAPNAVEEPMCLPEGVIVFEDGYYD